MKRAIGKLVVAFFLTTLVVSCGDDDDPVVINEEETITTVKLTMIEDGTSNSQVYTWKDGSHDAITLSANASYNIKIQFLDESDPNDVEDITEEVIEERDAHFVFYETTVTGLTFMNASDDTIDADNTGINISTNWSAADAASGILTAYLIHEPTTKTGDSRDDFGGETDIEVSFDVTVQ